MAVRDSQLGTSPPLVVSILGMEESADARRERALPVTFRVGLVLILIGAAWFGGWCWWASTQIWVPLDMPVSLAPGHIRAPELEINVESTYRIEITLQRVLDVKDGDWYSHCYPGFGCPLGLAVSWSLRKEGRVLARGSGTDDSDIGRFAAGKGRYALDVDVSQDGSRYSAYEPHLVVVETGDERVRADLEGFFAFGALLVLGAVGICLMVGAAILRRQDKQASLIRAWPLTQPGPQPALAVASGLFRNVRVIHPWSEGKYIGDPRTSASRPLSGLSWIALLLNILLPSAVAVVVMVSLEYPTPIGFKVRLLRPGVSAQPSPGIQPLIVRVERRGLDPARFYVNWQPVSPERLDSLLREELSRRPPDWPVCVEGDGDMELKEVLAVIDRLRGLHADVVLLTRAP